MEFFDTHAHYNDERYNENLEEILNENLNAGVKYIVNASYNLASSKTSIELANRYEYIYAAIGVHPHDIENDDYLKIKEIYSNMGNRKVVAIGEIGLDYAFVKDNKEAQIEGFIKQIEIAEELNLPIIIHSRDASYDTYNVIKNKKKPKVKVLFHCFAPSDDLVRLVIENGYTVAFGGNITFKRNESFKKYIEMIPIEQIVIETDSPYMSPEPYRGKLNSSKNLDIICKKLAEYKNMDYEDVSKITFENSKKFFNI